MPFLDDFDAADEYDDAWGDATAECVCGDIYADHHGPRLTCPNWDHNINGSSPTTFEAKP